MYLFNCRKTRQIDAISEQEPEIRILKVVLVGEDGADTSFGHYAKGIYVEEGGTLDIHGKEKLPWTRLTASLMPQSGFFDIHLAEEPVGWKMGDKVMIAYFRFLF